MEVDRDDDRITGEGRVRYRENIQATVEERMYPHHHMTNQRITTLDLVKAMKNNPSNNKYVLRGSTPPTKTELEYESGATTRDPITDPGSRVRGIYISSGEKPVGCVTNLAESKI